MNYAVVFVTSSGDTSEPIKGSGELTVVVPPGTANVTVDETNRIAGDQEVAVYSGQYLDVQVKSRGSSGLLQKFILSLSSLPLV